MPSGRPSTQSKLIMKLLTDAEFLAAASDGILSAEEQQLIMMRASATVSGLRLAGRSPT